MPGGPNDVTLGSAFSGVVMAATIVTSVGSASRVSTGGGSESAVGHAHQRRRSSTGPSWPGETSVPTAGHDHVGGVGVESVGATPSGVGRGQGRDSGRGARPRCGLGHPVFLVYGAASGDAACC